MRPLLSNLNYLFMPRNKVLERAKVSIDSGRSPFDLSEESAITSLAGEINVPYIQPIVKGTKGTINRSVIISRTADVVSPAFHRITEHFDFFLVPIHALWRQWENWKLNINDLQDTNVVRWNDVINTPNLNLPSNAPRLDFVNFISNFLGVDNASTTNTASDVRCANDALRMADWFQYCPMLMTDQVSSSVSKVMNVFMPAAYQKVYFEHYRNTAYESNNPYAYNFDWLYLSDKQGLLSSSGAQNSKDKTVVKELFKVRRVNYRNDYFHNLYPSLNYVSSIPTGLTGFSVPQNLGQILVGGGNSTTVNSGTVVATGVTRQSSAGGNYAGGVRLAQLSANNSAGISVQSIRAAFALDKLMRASAYAPKHVREQYKAQFGVDGQVYDSDMRSQRIGSFESSVVFQEVTNMAQSQNNNLGDLGAKGLGSSQSEKPIHFYAEYDSLLICMHYFLPRAKYDADGIFDWNTYLTRDSFYVKAFENLGLRPFYLHNYNGMLDDVLGFAWTAPNFVYKIKPDLNHCEFKESFFTYYLFNNEDDLDEVASRSLSDQLSTFVPHTLNSYASSTLADSWPWTADYFKVAPEDLDNVFRSQVPKDHRLGFYQFYTAYRVMCAVVAPMSVHGQPSL